MDRAVLQACWPWLLLLLVLVAVLHLLLRAARGRLHLGRLLELHDDQGGSAQSLSFVLTVPFFVMIMLFIVQVSQLMIGTVVVHYAAFAAARAAIVWIPANLGTEAENCVSQRTVDSEASNVFPCTDPNTSGFGPAEGGVTYVVSPGSEKYNKILAAAVLACMPICPSRNIPSVGGASGTVADNLAAAYQAMAPRTNAAAAARRLKNKLAYAVANTRIEVRF